MCSIDPIHYAKPIILHFANLSTNRNQEFQVCLNRFGRFLSTYQKSEIRILSANRMQEIQFYSNRFLPANQKRNYAQIASGVLYQPMKSNHELLSRIF